MSVLIETTLGDFVVDLFTKERPRTSMNFLKLCKTKYYNYTQFYSIQESFIAQTGDPTNSGRGGASIFEKVYGEQARFFEMESNPKLKHVKRGTVSMVNNGENAHGSQFFVTLGENLDFLDDKHTVFGYVAEGLDVLDKLNEVICDDNHRPYRDVWINHTIILDDPFPDPKHLDVPSRSPSPSPALLKYSRIGVDEEIDDTKGKTGDQVHEEMETKEAKARAHILEMIGDLHYAEERPPDNVLFVCKLNPVTTEDDLAIIFGRFGKIVSCEVIRDQKTGSSLQYAFIEFEKAEECETAYFKMDNVLIDDRRIHVDFSQSVSKNKNWRQELSSYMRRKKDGASSSAVDDGKRKESGKRSDRKGGHKRSRSRSPPRHYKREYENKDHREDRKRDRRRSPSPTRHSSSRKYKSSRY